MNGGKAASELVVLSRMSCEDPLKIPTVPLLNTRHFGSIKTLNSPCLIVSESGIKWVTTFSALKQGGITPSHSAVALSSCTTTSATSGRKLTLASQQRWTNAQSGSENPIVEALSGLAGRNPSTTEKIHPTAPQSGNGISPVRT